MLRRLEVCPPELMPHARSNECGRVAPDGKCTCTLLIDHESDHAFVSHSGLVHQLWPNVRNERGLDELEQEAFRTLTDNMEDIADAISRAELDLWMLSRKAKESGNTRLLGLLNQISIHGGAEDICDYPFGNDDEFKEEINRGACMKIYVIESGGYAEDRQVVGVFTDRYTAFDRLNTWNRIYTTTPARMIIAEDGAMRLSDNKAADDMVVGYRWDSFVGWETIDDWELAIHYGDDARVPTTGTAIMSAKDDEVCVVGKDLHEVRKVAYDTWSKAVGL